MKLFKKLLPIATIASATAIVAPIATSCTATAGGHIEIDLRTLADNRYVRKSALKPIVGVKDNSEALKMYVEDVNKNKDILADDIIEYVELYVMEYLGQTIRLDEDDTKAAGTITINVGKVNVDDSRLSYELKVDANVRVNMGDTDDDLTNDEDDGLVPMHIKLDAKFDNIQYCITHMEYDPTEQLWMFMPSCYNIEPSTGSISFDIWKLLSDKNWNIGMNLSITSDYFEQLGLEIAYDGQFNSETSIEQTYWNQLALNAATLLSFSSNYLANVSTLN